MRPTPWLRAASILTLFHSLSHTLGGVFGAPAPGAQQTAVDAMKTNLFPVMGVTRSMWEFYRGMGLAVTLFLTVEAIVFWFLGNLARESHADLRPLLAVFLVGYLVLAVNSLIYFFAPPVVVELLIAACLGMAIVSIKPPATLPA
jgi:hypothetical protein